MRLPKPAHDGMIPDVQVWRPQGVGTPVCRRWMRLAVDKFILNFEYQQQRPAAASTVSVQTSIEGAAAREFKSQHAGADGILTNAHRSAKWVALLGCP